ncbi:MAG TPA: hypothetical protein VN802_12550 [Stellaceae bacterium]|nr:hypothetical protein [Stellaceae bacterium]
MIDPDARQGSGGQATRGFRGFCHRVDRACATLNSGLAAAAIVLAVVVFVTAAVRLPVMLTDALPTDVPLEQADQ